MTATELTAILLRTHLLDLIHYGDYSTIFNCNNEVKAGGMIFAFHSQSNHLKHNSMELHESIIPIGERSDKLAIMSEFAPVPGKLSALEQMLEELRIKNLEAIRLLSKDRKSPKVGGSSNCVV